LTAQAAPSPLAVPPPAYAGMRIGLFGGSFNPPHEGHRLVALQALKRLGLDAVWLLVSPGNPLKDHADLAPLAERLAAARRIMHHPAIRVTGFEAARRFSHTYETLSFLRTAFPGVRFVWIMGADNLASFDRWQHWRRIAEIMPFAVVDRPGWRLAGLSSPAAQSLSRSRLPESEARSLADRKPPAWILLTIRLSGLSSTALRTAKPSAGGK
jgi:nicotinate-nucleotide adenylyltransferase